VRSVPLAHGDVGGAPASRADHPDEVLGRNRQERQQ
jgi:hypothetical protein